MDAPRDRRSLPSHPNPKWLLFLLASTSLQPAVATVAGASTLLRREESGRVGAYDAEGVEAESTEGSAQEALAMLKVGNSALLDADETHNNGGTVSLNDATGRTVKSAHVAVKPAHAAEKLTQDVVPQSLTERIGALAKKVAEVKQHYPSPYPRKLKTPPEVFSQLRAESGEQSLHDWTFAKQQSEVDALVKLGVRGPPGMRGSLGEPGENGKEGGSGGKGPQGELVAGLPGEKGEQGEFGPKGLRGERGPAGPPGAIGDKWDSTEEARQMIAFGNELYARYMELTEFQDKVSSQLLAETNQIADETGADDAALKQHGNDIMLLQQAGEETKQQLEHAKERETFIMKEMPRKIDRIKRVHQWLDRAYVKVEHEQNTTLPSDNATLTPDAPPEEKGDTSASGYLKELAATTFDWTHLKLQHLFGDFYKDVAHSNDDDGAEVQKQNEQAPRKAKETKEAKPDKPYSSQAK